MFIDQNHLHFNSFATTHLLNLAHSKRLETASQRKDQTNGQSKTDATPFKLVYHRTGGSLLASFIVIFLSHGSQRIHKDVLYYIPTIVTRMKKFLYW